MTQSNYTHITFLLDKSGSMDLTRDDTIGTFNAFLEEQKQVSGKCTFSLILFNHLVDTVHDFVNIRQIEPLTRKTFVPNGGTALLDAMGLGIDNLGGKLNLLVPNQRPEKILFVILTDGAENSSKLFSQHQVFDRIDHQQKKYSWDFVFLGANQDAIATASSFGIPRSHSFTYQQNSVGLASLSKDLNKATTLYRCSSSKPETFFEEKEPVT